MESIMLENILIAMEDVTFGKDTAASIVGGKQKLLNLIANGEVRGHKQGDKQNSKWFCNAADVLRHCKNYRKSNQPK